MPIAETDPWRFQYFEGVPCPAHVRVPTEDADAHAWNPDYAWVYNKLRVAQTQGLACGIAGEMPHAWPVFAKPIVNFRGMGTQIAVLNSVEDYNRYMSADLFWSELLTGEHLSTDAAIVDGKPHWWRHARGAPGRGGTFDYWAVFAGARPETKSYCGAWLRDHLSGYTGMVNFETIGGRIIEVHLRFADQWPDLYGGRPWVEALIRLYERKAWVFDDHARRDGFSVVLFGEHGIRYRHPPRTLIDRITATPDISSVQISFHEGRPPEHHPMPPGGFRLAIVNCWDLQAGIAARARLSAAFAGAHEKRAGLPKETREGDEGSG